MHSAADKSLQLTAFDEFAGALKVVVYEGQSRDHEKGVTVAADLASADLVLTTYDVLAHDTHYHPDKGIRTYVLRGKKKYEVNVSSNAAMGLLAAIFYINNSQIQNPYMSCNLVRHPEQLLKAVAILTRRSFADNGDPFDAPDVVESVLRYASTSKTSRVF